MDANRAVSAGCDGGQPVPSPNAAASANPGTTEPNSATEESLQDSQSDGADYDSLISNLKALREELLRAEKDAEESLAAVHPTFQESARNLVHYLALRRHDVRPLQMQLAALGLSSLGRAESHVLANLDAVLTLLQRLAQRGGQPPEDSTRRLDLKTGAELLAKNTTSLLGAPPVERDVRIMVTMPSSAAEDYMLVHELLKHGMNCMRINCAHDDAPSWSRMIAHLRRAGQATQRSCRILMDAAGPKLRTGPLAPGPAVVKIRPKRNELGRVTRKARVWLCACEAPRLSPSAADATLQVPASWLSSLEIGDKIKFKDARKARRILQVVDVTSEGCWAEADQSAYVASGTTLRCRRKRNAGKGSKAKIGQLRNLEIAIALKPGDLLVLKPTLEPGRPATVDSSGSVLTPAWIGCSAAEIFDHVKTGEPIWFDDGKIGGTIEKIESGQLHIRITQTRASGAKLRSGRGINLPATNLQLPAITPKDAEDLKFIAQHADMVALSFANDVRDVELLQKQSQGDGEWSRAIVLQRETRRGHEDPPASLLA